MRLPNTAHTSRPWRIHELTRDFRLEDVWVLPTPGHPGDFPRLVQLIASSDPSQVRAARAARAARALWAIRWKAGELLGLDGPDTGLGSRVPTLRDRLPVDLREAPPGPDFDTLPFTSLYLLDDEFAAEIANRTMHGIMHIGWVADGTGAYRGQMAVLVKPNGVLGTAYMAAIRLFRHLIVYPQMMREIEWIWAAGDTGRMVDNTARDRAIYQALKAADEVAAALQAHLIEEHQADPDRAAAQNPATNSLKLLRQARERLGQGLRAVEADNIAESDRISLRNP